MEQSFQEPAALMLRQRQGWSRRGGRGGVGTGAVELIDRDVGTTKDVTGMEGKPVMQVPLPGPKQKKEQLQGPCALREPGL